MAWLLLADGRCCSLFAVRCWLFLLVVSFRWCSFVVCCLVVLCVIRCVVLLVVFCLSGVVCSC